MLHFAFSNFWELAIQEGSPFLWKNQSRGKHSIRDAVDLNGIPDELYDFVCATAVLEYITSSFKALLQGIRIMRSGGLLLIIVPFTNLAFDHKRKVV
jgi:ubiquinone/menaquinone biosynthesis C-methylase UbiE